MKIQIDLPIYSSTIVFFVNEELKDCMGLLVEKSRTKDIVESFSNHNPENGLVTWEGNDLRLQYCYLGKMDLDHPHTYNRVSHEIYHIANNIATMTGMKHDSDGSEHIAYLIGHITEEFFGKFFGYEKEYPEV